MNIAKFLRIGFFIWYLLCYCSSISISLSLSRKILSVAICLIGLGQLQIFLIYTNLISIEISFIKRDFMAEV